jgi:hypothetical protein
MSRSPSARNCLRPSGAPSRPLETLSASPSEASRLILEVFGVSEELLTPEQTPKHCRPSTTGQLQTSRLAWERPRFC